MTRREARRAAQKPHPADNGGKWIAPAKRRAIYDRDGHKCVYCGRNGDDSKLTLDHLQPVELGGGNEAKNLVTACLACNSARGKKTIRQFEWYLKNVLNEDPEEVKKRIRRQVRRKLVGYTERMRK